MIVKTKRVEKMKIIKQQKPKGNIVVYSAIAEW